MRSSPIPARQVADIPDVDLSTLGSHTFGSFQVEVVDYTTDYFATLKVCLWSVYSLAGVFGMWCVHV